MFEKFRIIFFLVQKKFVKYLESWKKHDWIFFSKSSEKVCYLGKDVWNFYQNLSEFSKNYSTKSIISQKMKIVFSFVSAHCAPLMKVWSKLRGGVCWLLVGTETRSRIGWIKRKIKFQIFIFRVMVIFSHFVIKLSIFYEFFTITR